MTSINYDYPIHVPLWARRVDSQSHEPCGLRSQCSFGYQSRKNDSPSPGIQMPTGKEENIPANNGTDLLKRTSEKGEV